MQGATYVMQRCLSAQSLFTVGWYAVVWQRRTVRRHGDFRRLGCYCRELIYHNESGISTPCSAIAGWRRVHSPVCQRLSAPSAFRLSPWRWLRRESASCHCSALAASARRLVRDGSRTMSCPYGHEVTLRRGVWRHELNSKRLNGLPSGSAMVKWNLGAAQTRAC